jgi:hypothetical protein
MSPDNLIIEIIRLEANKLTVTEKSGAFATEDEPDIFEAQIAE